MAAVLLCWWPTHFVEFRRRLGEIEIRSFAGDGQDMVFVGRDETQGAGDTLAIAALRLDTLARARQIERELLAFARCAMGNSVQIRTVLVTIDASNAFSPPAPFL